MKIRWKVLIFSLLIIYSVAFLGSLFTSQNTNSEWYEEIRPSITPPNFVFPVVWNILFFLIGLSLYFVWIKSKKIDKKKIIYVFGINFFLNIFWSYLYFGIRNPLFAFFEIILLEISIGTMIFVSWRIDKKAAYMLIPYFIWVGFASVLNFLSI